MGGLTSITPKNLKLISEQELRRFELLNYPNYLPKTDRHRPDGYWIVECDNSINIIALELELSQKAHDLYNITGKFYRDYPQVDTVLWVVPKKGMAVKLLESLTKSIYNQEPCHSFILLGDFVSNGWQSIIFHGKNKGKSIEDLLVNTPSTRSQPVAYSYILDGRKYPKNSIVSISKEILNSFNWVPSQLKTENSLL